ncbi:HAD family phosphatase [Patescibacteria group bacterium]|nr:HAD family phosphatase [Patescibacteria group bacterium]MBU1703723.1 HAD family phosphatase [Patescibacteria group bacterium]MBU1953622.1 HAD family phosphatase [Patescibacteria group bacterium]
MIKVIIFDLDGLLVDSQPLQYKAYNHVFSRYGFPLSKEDWKEWIQHSYSAGRWIRKRGLQLDPDVIRAEKKVIYDELIEKELELKPGAGQVISKLGEKYRLCVASSSRIESINLVLKKFKLAEKFQEVISDTEMDRGKPFPDIFLEAADRMGVKPNECLVIEDSIAGLKAAKAAGMKCIICPDTFCEVDLSDFAGADLIVDKPGEVVAKMVEGLGK